MSYEVTSPLVIVPNDDGKGGDGYFYENAVIPDGFNDERCEQLVKEGMLKKVKAEEASTGDSIPAKSASKGDWVAYATDDARGESKLSAEDAEGMTRDQLAEKFTSAS